MKKLEGNRKFFIALTALIINGILSAIVIIQISEPVALIAALGGNITAICSPFMLSNYGENKVKAANGKLAAEILEDK